MSKFVRAIANCPVPGTWTRTLNLNKKKLNQNRTATQLHITKCTQVSLTRTTHFSKLEPQPHQCSALLCCGETDQFSKGMNMWILPVCKALNSLRLAGSYSMEMGVSDLVHIFLSSRSHKKYLTDCHQIWTEGVYGQTLARIKFWWPWHNFQGHCARKKVKNCTFLSCV